MVALLYNLFILLITLGICYGLYWFLTKDVKHTHQWEKDENTPQKGCLPILILAFILKTHESKVG